MQHEKSNDTKPLLVLPAHTAQVLQFVPHWVGALMQVIGLLLSRSEGNILGVTLGVPFGNVEGSVDGNKLGINDGLMEGFQLGPFDD